MPLRDLNPAEVRIVGECLRAVASGQIILDDREFPTLFGISFGQLGSVAESWPDVDEHDDVVQLAVGNSLNTLTGYPHGRDDIWADHISVPSGEVVRILSLWHGPE